MNTVTVTETKNQVTVNETTNTVTVQEGVATVVTVKTEGPQGPIVSDGDKGDVTVSSNGTSVTVNAGAIDNANIASNAAIDLTKLATGTFPSGLKINTDNILTGAVTTGKIATGTIINGDISLTAAIAGTKISPNFGSQNITTSGTIETTGNQISVSGASPSITFTDNDQNPDFKIICNDGRLEIQSPDDNDVVRMSVRATDTRIHNSLKALAGLTVTGIINSSGSIYANGNIIGDSNTNISGIKNIDITGNLTVNGNMTVSGTTTTIDTSVLTVEDINIELGKVSTPTDTTADGGGLTLKGATDKTFQWLNATDSWTSSEHIALPDSKKLKLGTDGDVEFTFDGTDALLTTDTAGSLKIVGNTQFSGGGNNGDVLFTGASGKDLNWNKSDGSLDFSDATKARFGDNYRLSISAGDTLGRFRLEGGVPLIISKSTTENIAKFIPDGAVELYYDNVKKLDTKSWGVFIHGSLVANGVIKVNSYTNKFVVGAGDEFSILHNDTDTIIENTAGNLHIRPKASEEGIKLIPDGAVELYYDNVKRFETTSTGITASGTQHILTSGTSGDCELIIQADSDNNDENDNPRIVFKQDGSHTANSIGVNHPNGSDQNDLYLASGGLNTDIIFYTGYDSSANGSYTGAIERLRVRSDGHISIPADDKKLLIGVGNDLQIYHSGHFSFIKDAGTGGLAINTNNLLIRNAANNEEGLIFTENGKIELYYDNVKRFETTSTAAQVFATNNGDGFVVTAGEGGAVTVVDQRNAAYKGTFYMGGSAPVIRNHNTSTSDHTLRIQKGTTFIANFDGTGNFQLPADNKKIQLGASQDLQIYHSGTGSYIDHTTVGNLFIRGNSVNHIYIRPKGGENSIVAYTNAGVELYYDSSKKIETTSTGASVTGQLGIGTTSPARDLSLHSGDASSIFAHFTNTDTGTTASDGCIIGLGASEDLVLNNQETGKNIIFENGGSERLRITSDGNLQIPNDTGKLLIGASQDLELFHDGSHSVIKDAGTGMLKILGSTVSIKTGNDNENLAIFIPNSSVSLFFDNSKKIETTSTGATVTTSSAANSIRNITTSTSQPSGGSDGDLWFTYVA